MCCSTSTEFDQLNFYERKKSAETKTSLNLGHSCIGGTSLKWNGRYVFPMIIMWDCDRYMAPNCLHPTLSVN